LPKRQQQLPLKFPWHISRFGDMQAAKEQEPLSPELPAREKACLTAFGAPFRSFHLPPCPIIFLYATFGVALVALSREV
jgi:hypothetical protein